MSKFAKRPVDDSEQQWNKWWGDDALPAPPPPAEDALDQDNRPRPERQRITLKWLRAQITACDDADLTAFARALSNQLSALPELSRQSKQPVSLHVATTPATIRLLSLVVDQLCH